MLVLLVAVGQMAQTIIFPPSPIWHRKRYKRREGAVQGVMAAYLDYHGVSRAVLRPAFRRPGLNRPVILVGMSIFMVATLFAMTRR